MKKKLLVCFLAVMLVAVLVFVAAPSTQAADDSLLTASVDGQEFTISEGGKTLDLKGYKNVVVKFTANVELTVIDSANMELDGKSAGTLKVEGEGTIAHISRDANYRYLRVLNDDGTYSFHPFNLMFTRIGINTLAGENDDKVEVCVQIAFIANSVVRDNYLGNYGICSVATGIETPANEKYPFNTKNGVRAYIDLADSLTKDNIDSTANYKAYMYVDGEKVESAYTLAVTPREILKKVNASYKAATPSQLERINAMISTNVRAENILTNITGKECVHHGGIAPYMEQAACIDCDSKYGELGIPEGAVMVTDFGETLTPTLISGWGSAGETWETFSEHDGRTGVFALGKVTESWFGLGCLEKMDLTQYESITFRMKINSTMSGMWLINGLISGQRTNVALSSLTKGQWIEYTLSTASIPTTSDTENSGTLTFQTRVTDATDYTVYIDQIYVTPKADTVLKEQDIPEGATLVTDFSEKGNHTIVNYSSYANATDNWYQMCAGAVGVQAFGTTEISGGNSFIKWRDILPTDFDYSKYTHITFRVYFTNSVRAVQLATFPDGDPYAAATNVYDLYNEGTVTYEKGQWHNITISLDQLKDFDLFIGNKQWNYGDIVLFDQVYVECKEQDYPEGATLITDFSETVAPGVNPNNYGGNSGAVAGNYSSYEVFDNRLGVFAMGATGNYWMWYYSVDLENVDLTKYTTITFRLKTRSDLQTLDLVFNANQSMALIEKITKGEWTEVTVNVADIEALGVTNLASVDFSFKFYASESSPCEYVWFDQVYGQ